MEILNRIKCVKCGMVANIDPYFHKERYGHFPVIRGHGNEELTFSDRCGAFVQSKKHDSRFQAA